MSFNVKIKVPKGLDDKVIDSGIKTLTEDVLPLLSTHHGRIRWLERAKKDGHPVEYSPFWDDDKLLQYCIEIYWQLFEKIIQRRN